MLRTWVLLALTFLLFTATPAHSIECSGAADKRISLGPWSTDSLASPDGRWALVSIGPSSENPAGLYMENTEAHKKWKIGSIERSGTAFWSNDSKRLFLRDEYAADDTKIRVFDASGATPTEVKGLNVLIREALYAHIPKSKMAQWVYYPNVCFSANDSSTIIVVADAPLVPKRGDGSGVTFGVKITVNLVTRRVIDLVLSAQ